MKFFRELDLVYEDEQHFYVHAGVPNIPLEAIDLGRHRNELLWVRERFLRSTYPWNKTIVHGHTPTEEAEVTEQRINVDTGCVFEGHLSAVQLPARQIYSVPRRSNVPPVVLRDHTSSRAAVRFKVAFRVRVFLDGALYEFETLDFSEFGMLMRDLSFDSLHELQKGDRISGEVGADPDNMRPFSGRVVRASWRESGMHYAVMLDPEEKGFKKF